MKSLVDWSKELHESQDNISEKEGKKSGQEAEGKKMGEGEEKMGGIGSASGGSFEMQFGADGSNDLVRFERQMMYNQQVS